MNSKQKLSKLFFGSRSRKIRNAAELYCLIKTAVTSSNTITASVTDCEAVEDSQYFEFASANSIWQKDSPVIRYPAAGLSKVLFKDKITSIDDFPFSSYLLARTISLFLYSEDKTVRNRSFSSKNCHERLFFGFSHTSANAREI